MSHDPQLLGRTIESEYPNLLLLTEELASRVPKPGAWSPKEELGHLIDSAINNHARFVRGTLEDGSQSLSYAQDDWVRLHGYAEMDWDTIVVLWLQHNVLLARLVERIPINRWDTKCVVGTTEMTLGFLIEDYVFHMRHYLDHLLGKVWVTPYPRG